MNFFSPERLTPLEESLPAAQRQRLARQSKSERRQTLRRTMAAKSVRVILILTFLAVFVFAGLEATFAMWTERKFGWGVLQNGYVFAFLGLISALVQGGLVGRLRRRFGELGLIRQGFVALAAGLALLPAASNLPLMVDADHGYGNALNVRRTVEELETAGIAGLTIEDTELPQAFGTVGSTRLISLEEGIGKMRAALDARQDSNLVIVGRTGAPQITDIGDAVRRIQVTDAGDRDALEFHVEVLPID